MTLKGKLDKGEGMLHAMVKFMIYFQCRQLKHTADIEVNLGESGIVDVVDYSTGLGYEVQTIMNPKTLKEKTFKYLQNAELNDIIFIKTKDFNKEMTVKDIYKKIKEIVV